MDTLKRVQCLVADSASFIRNAPLQNISEKVYTILEVINEIKDPQTRQRLAVLPYEVNFREPSQESIKFVTEFSKKTGDFKSLSAVDIRVLALTYQLEKEFCDVLHIKSEPTSKTSVVPEMKFTSDNQMAGFYITKKESDQSKASDECKQEQMETDLSKVNDNGNTDDIINQLHVEETRQTVMGERNNNGDERNENDTMDEYTIEEGEKLEDGDGEETLDDNDEDGGGWITPQNLNDMKLKMGVEEGDELSEANAKCVCLTTDFAMQNVLIQMGLHVISMEGRLIHHVRSYIQKCYGCNKETHDMTRMFCPSCGNNTLRKVAISVDSDGTIQYHYSRKGRNFNIRGTKFSLPQPKGGRHGDDIITCEDQKKHIRNMPKQKDYSNALDPDYVGNSSPFAATDITSRAFNLGLHIKQTRDKNPNQNRKKKSGKRK